MDVCLLPLSRWLLAGLIIRLCRWRRYVPPKLLLTFKGLHGVVFQKIYSFLHLLCLVISRQTDAVRCTKQCTRRHYKFYSQCYNGKLQSERMCDFTSFSFYNIISQIILFTTQNLKSLSTCAPNGTGASLVPQQISVYLQRNIKYICMRILYTLYACA
jgi:hypothetical protein